MSSIRIIGPADTSPGEGFLRIDATSRSLEPWAKMLSPFHLGPCHLYGGESARRLENGWQHLKVHKEHVDFNGDPTDAYWRWARKGWLSTWPTRYPMGKGAKPEYLLWGGKRLGYIESRCQVYWPLYRDAVRGTEAFRHLQDEYAAGRSIAIFDLKGYDHDARGVSTSDVVLDTTRSMGHAFVLKCMLLLGPQVTPEQVISMHEAAPADEWSYLKSLNL